MPKTERTYKHRYGVAEDRTYARTFDVCGFTVIVEATIGAERRGTVRAEWNPPRASSVNEREAFRSELARALADFTNATGRKVEE